MSQLGKYRMSSIFHLHISKMCIKTKIISKFKRRELQIRPLFEFSLLPSIQFKIGVVLHSLTKKHYVICIRFPKADAYLNRTHSKAIQLRLSVTEL